MTTHIRDTAVFEHPRGAAVQWVALGDGSVDFAGSSSCIRSCARKLHAARDHHRHPAGYHAVSRAGFWKVFQDTPAWEFARFLKLVKSGHPYMGPMVIAGWGKQAPAMAAAFKEQQRVDLERSLEYAKKVAGRGREVEELSAANTSAVPIRLGFDSYSIRDFRWKDIQLLDYAAGLKLDTIQLSGLDDYESLEPEHLAKVKEHAARVGIAIDAGMGCICPLSQAGTRKTATRRSIC